MKVPFADLHAQYQSIKQEIDDAIRSVIESSAFIRGPFVERFEHEFARATGNSHCVSCANGTDALYIAMRALDVRPGDEVITSAHSWIATSETITQAGGHVVFCDTDAETYTIDADAIEGKVTSRTVGIIPVHLYGQPADMDRVMAIARKHGLWVIEDCAQAHLATYKGVQVGSFGNAAAFSFYPGKNLGAMGDAGALVTNDASLAREMASFARHGGIVKGEHEMEGINSRLDGLQAAILSAKLKHLANWTRSRQELAQHYLNQLAEVESVATPFVRSDSGHVWHLFVIRHERRDALASHLGSLGIQTAVNYPIALPFLPAYRRLGHAPSDFPNAFAHQSRILSLPMFVEMTSAQQQLVIGAIKEFGG